MDVESENHQHAADARSLTSPATDGKPRGCSEVTTAACPLLDHLVHQVAVLVQRSLARHEIAQVWSEGDRILFRLADGRTGDIELLVNWDVGGVAQDLATP